MYLVVLTGDSAVFMPSYITYTHNIDRWFVVETCLRTHVK